MLNCELCRSTSKPINNEKNTLKSFIAFDIASSLFLKWLWGVKLWSPTNVKFEKSTIKLHVLLIYFMPAKFLEDQKSIIMSLIKYLDFKFL